MLLFDHRLLILVSPQFLELHIQWNIPFQNQTRSYKVDTLFPDRTQVDHTLIFPVLY